MKNQISTSHVFNLAKELREESGAESLSHYESLQLALKFTELTILQKAHVISSTDKYPAALELIAMNTTEIKRELAVYCEQQSDLMQAAKNSFDEI